MSKVTIFNDIENVLVEVGSLKPKDFFIWGGELYLKTNQRADCLPNVKVVKIETGTSLVVDAEIPVRRVDVDIHYRNHEDV